MLLGALGKYLELSWGALGRFLTFLDDLDSILDPPKIDFQRFWVPMLGLNQSERTLSQAYRQTRCEAKARRVDPSRRQTNTRWEAEA